MVHRLNFWRAVVGAGQPWQRRAFAIGVVVSVVAVHGCVAEHVADRMMDLTVYADMPERVEVMYVREMEPSAPAKVAAAVPRPPAKTRHRSARPAASAPVVETTASVASAAEPVASATTEPASAAPAASQATTDLASATEAAAQTPDATASSALPVAGAGSAPAFAWPASTRLSYVLTGNWRGEIHGTAQVEWVRIGNHYQVHLDVLIGLPIFAPLYSRKMTSAGELSPQGLVPQTFDQDTSGLAVGERRRVKIRFEPDAIVLADGRRNEPWPGVQDAASQFVQLTYLFTTRPELLAQGKTIDMPLALPSNVTRWVFDVLETEPLYTPFGAVDGVHLKPRRIAQRGGDMTAEIWIAPMLAYLPARIRIQQDSDTFIDLMLKRKPQLASE